MSRLLGNIYAIWYSINKQTDLAIMKNKTIAATILSGKGKSKLSVCMYKNNKKGAQIFPVKKHLRLRSANPFS